jgi:hypothetical protein
MKAIVKVVCIVVAIGALALAGALFLFRYSITNTLQNLRSPDSKHTAKLVRSDGMDRVYSIELDGSTVYISPDFSPTTAFPFREALYFTPDSKFLVLEIGGHRVTGVDATSGATMSDAELLALPQPPTPELREYRFEGDWPGIGRAR